MDVERTAVRFEISVFYLFTRDGRFTDVTIALQTDETTGDAEIHASIGVDSVRMKDPKDAATLKSEDYFYVEQFPYITFSAVDIPAHVLQVGGAISGTLTMRGMSQPVSFAISRQDCPQPLCPLLGEAKIDRTAFGMTAKRGILSRQVKIFLELYPAVDGGSP